jgi:hypothetical protein
VAWSGVVETLVTKAAGNGGEGAGGTGNVPGGVCTAGAAATVDWGGNCLQPHRRDNPITIPPARKRLIIDRLSFMVRANWRTPLSDRLTANRNLEERHRRGNYRRETRLFRKGKPYQLLSACRGDFLKSDRIN